MKIYLAAMIAFLLAFSGLAAGLILRRRGLRGGCSGHAAGAACSCESAGQKEVKVLHCEKNNR